MVSSNRFIVRTVLGDNKSGFSVMKPEKVKFQSISQGFPSPC